MDVQRKLEVLADAAKYDASCVSSGAKRKGGGGLGNSTGVGICHSYTPDGRCVSLLKILLTNFCIYDCQFCVNRVSSSTPRARFTVDEIVRLTVEFYKRNYIEGLFLSSGIIRSPDYTMEQLTAVAKSLRVENAFRGYIHLKTIPLASEDLVAEAGRWADRAPQRVAEMVRHGQSPALTAVNFLPDRRELASLQAAARKCEGCPLHAGATQTVFGEGPADAKLVLVGEQPGDEEDRAGKPFVGPAGRLLDETLRAAEIDREEVYLTNAVKHFSYVRRGKRRLHKKPWDVVLWMQFATILPFCLRWLSRRYLTGSVLGLLGGPLAFYAGERLGAVSFLSPKLFHFAVLGMVWALAFPPLVWLSDTLVTAPGFGGRYRIFKSSTSVDTTHG